MAGTITDTYAAALQHGLVELADAAWLLGVVRRPTPWLYAVVDENEPDLGPPADLLEAAKARQRDLEAAGRPAAVAHNEAMDDVDFDRRYRAYLRDSPDAGAAIDRVLDTVADGTDVVLVCYENTDEKRCHRTVLREALLARR